MPLRTNPRISVTTSITSSSRRRASAPSCVCSDEWLTAERISSTEVIQSQVLTAREISLGVLTLDPRLSLDATSWRLSISSLSFLASSAASNAFATRSGLRKIFWVGNSGNQPLSLFKRFSNRKRPSSWRKYLLWRLDADLNFVT